LTKERNIDSAELYTKDWAKEPIRDLAKEYIGDLITYVKKRK